MMSLIWVTYKHSQGILNLENVLCMNLQGDFFSTLCQSVAPENDKYEVNLIGNCLNLL